MTERDFRYEMPDGEIVEAFQVTDASLFQGSLSPDWMDSQMLMTQSSMDKTKGAHWLKIGDDETEIPKYGWILKDSKGRIRAVDYSVMEAATKVVQEVPKVPDAAVPMTDAALMLASRLAKKPLEQCRAEDLANVEEANRNRQAIIDSLTPEQAEELGLTQAPKPEDGWAGNDIEREKREDVGSRMTYCSICSCKFDAEYEGVEGDIGIIPVAFCATCKTGIRDFAEQMWDLAPTGNHPTLRIPYHTFKNPVCRGDPSLGNNCGHCEKCEWLAGNAD